MNCALEPKEGVRAIDLFAGPGGWDLAAKALDIDPLGRHLGLYLLHGFEVVRQNDSGDPEDQDFTYIRRLADVAEALEER